MFRSTALRVFRRHGEAVLDRGGATADRRQRPRRQDHGPGGRELLGATGALHRTSLTAVSAIGLRWLPGLISTAYSIMVAPPRTEDSWTGRADAAIFTDSWIPRFMYLPPSGRSPGRSRGGWPRFGCSVTAGAAPVEHFC